jgi:uncharacterized membrane protein
VAAYFLYTNTVTAQLSPRAQIILDFLQDEGFITGKVVAKEIDGTLFISGRKTIRKNNTPVEQEVWYKFNVNTRTLTVQQLQPVGIPDAGGGGTNTNGDGSCVVGFQDAGFFTPFHASRWTEAAGPLDLGTLDTSNNASRSSFATDTSEDCSVVVGLSDITGGASQHAFRWTANGGLVDLTVPPGGGPNSRALGVSNNGTIVVGDADFPASGFTRRGAFRWSGGSFQDLGASDPSVPSIATAVSGDGSVVVGQIGTTTVSSAFRWTTTQNPQLQPINPLPTHAAAAATAVSDNGKIVAGISHPTFLQYQGVVLGWNQGIAFRWTQAGGTKELRQLLIDKGVDMTGVNLVSVSGMSVDGQWIIGKATTPTTPQGEFVPYIVQYCDDDIGGPCSTTAGGGAAPFTLGASPTQLTVSAGQNTSTTITVTPNAGFTQPVTFSCGGLPQGAACSFNPATLTPNGGPVNTTLTISTNGGAVALLSPNSSFAMFAYALTPFVILPVGLLLQRHEIQGRLFSIAVGFVAALTLVGMLSCSSSSDSPPPASNTGGTPPATGTPAGTSNVTVTASSGGGSTSVPVTLTVTR